MVKVHYLQHMVQEDPFTNETIVFNNHPIFQQQNSSSHAHNSNRPMPRIRRIPIMDAADTKIRASSSSNSLPRTLSSSGSRDNADCDRVSILHVDHGMSKEALGSSCMGLGSSQHDDLVVHSSPAYASRKSAATGLAQHSPRDALFRLLNEGEFIIRDTPG